MIIPRSFIISREFPIECLQQRSQTTDTVLSNRYSLELLESSRAKRHETQLLRLQFMQIYSTYIYMSKHMTYSQILICTYCDIQNNCNLHVLMPSDIQIHIVLCRRMLLSQLFVHKKQHVSNICMRILSYLNKRPNFCQNPAHIHTCLIVKEVNRAQETIGKTLKNEFKKS